MKLTFQKPYRSIKGEVSTSDLNDFIVLSGPNGSGKSQLLEAIADGSIRVDDIAMTDGAVRLFSINQLVAPAESAQATNSLTSSWASLKAKTQQESAEISAAHEKQPLDVDAFDRELAKRLEQNQGVLAGLTETLVDLAGKRLVDFTDLDFQRYTPLIHLRRDPFQPSITELFLSYHNRYTLNKFQQWMQAEGDPLAIAPLSDDEFEERFGGPPWTLLDSILTLIGLDYAFVPPTGVTEHENYTAMLRHKRLGDEVRTEFLSSGEKTLLALAMSLYTGSQAGEAIRLPKVLLLDEPDASLHPEMVQSLLRVARETFVARHNVKVLLTTHSATTVALAPEESLHVMRRDSDPRLKKASNRDEALKSLTVGLSTLSVSIDNRRTVFVESEHDEGAYQELFRIVAPSLQSEFSLDFVASGRGGQGNCDAVKYLVSNLRSAGNSNVWGIVDRDMRQGAADGIVFNPERYSIENIVFDPLVFGAFLLRDGIVSSEELGLDQGLRHFSLDADHAQSVIDTISTAVTLDGVDEMTAVEYAGGFTANVPTTWLNIRGHNLKDQLVNTYPQLKAREREFLFDVIGKGYGDLPHFIPKSVLVMFEDLLSTP